MSEVKVINEVYDAVNDTTVSIAKGTIERINIKRINEDGSPKITNINNGPNKGKTIKSTHRASLLLKQGEDQVWISFGEHEVKNLKYENQYQIKEGEVWVDLKPGMVIRLPVQIRTWKDKSTGEDRSSPEGKKARITITDKSGARDVPAQSAPQGSSAASGGSQASGGATTKVYGTIISEDGLHVVVKLEDGKEVNVVLTKEQHDEIKVGGRLAGQRDAEGKIVSGFKAYGPAGQGGSSSGGKGKPKDDLPVRLGNALTITHAMFPEGDITENEVIVIQVLKAMDHVREKLRPDFKSLDDYSFGSRLGQSGILAAPAGRANIETFVEKVEKVFRFICQTEDKIRAEGSAPADTKPEPQLQPKPEDVPQSTPVVNGHVDFNQPPMDFDDDVPF